MKSMLNLLAVLALCGCAHPITHPVGDVPRRDLVGAWFGFEDGFAHAYRLVLRDDGTGTLSRHYFRATNDVTNYKIDRWKSTSLSIDMDVESTGDDEEVSLSASTGPEYIELRVKGRGWEHKVTLNKETRVEQELDVFKRVR
jgi:hypothetical protein